MIAWVLASLLAQQQDSTGFDLELVTRLRTGVWASGGFQFEALTLDGKREIDGQSLWSAGAEVGVAINNEWLVIAGFDYNWGNDVELTCAQLSFGWRTFVEKPIESVPPFRLEVFAGALWGHFNVLKGGFGDFEDGIGAQGGVNVMFDIADSMTLGAYISGRWILFDYKNDVIDGDVQVGGGGAVASLMFELSW